MRTTLRNFGLALVVTIAASELVHAGSETPARRTFPTGGVFTGQFKILTATDPLNGLGDTNVFHSMVGRRVDFKASFDGVVSDLYTAEADGTRKRILITSPAQISFVGQNTDYLRSVVAPTLHCGIKITIRETADGESFIENFEIAKPQMPQYFSFACDGPVELAPSTSETRGQDADLDQLVVHLQRYNAMTQVTDWATGIVIYSIVENITVAVEPTTFSQVKAMYGAVQQ